MHIVTLRTDLHLWCALSGIPWGRQVRVSRPTRRCFTPFSMTYPIIKVIIIY